LKLAYPTVGKEKKKELVAARAELVGPGAPEPDSPQPAAVAETETPPS
jgi:hypothetical protein